MCIDISIILVLVYYEYKKDKQFEEDSKRL